MFDAYPMIFDHLKVDIEDPDHRAALDYCFRDPRFVANLEYIENHMECGFGLDAPILVSPMRQVVAALGPAFHNQGICFNKNPCCGLMRTKTEPHRGM